MDHSTFTHLWTAAKPAVEAFLASLVHDHAAVDDLTQEVAMAVFQQIGRYDAERAFTPWVIAIARNKAYEHLRRNSARLRLLKEEAAESLAQAALRIEHEFEPRESALEACLEELPERSSRLLRLHYGEGRDLTTVATETGLTLANVKVLLHRIRNALRACVEKRIALHGGQP